jgi:hypothetical protein
MDRCGAHEGRCSGTSGMKHQYFGDINDYRKYGLLRALTEASGLALGVCWLLTQADQRSDGEFRAYLENPRRLRAHDPELYQALLRLMETRAERSVAHAETWGLLPGASYFTEVLGDRLQERVAYFTRAWAALAECPLIFFDPDNGLEVKSIRRGNRESSKFLYWVEVEEAWRRGHSLVIYQHWPREKRDACTKRLVGECVRRLGAPLVASFATAHVLFLVVGQEQHREGLRRAHDLILERWQGQIEPMAHLEGTPGNRPIRPEDIPDLGVVRNFEGGSVSVGSLNGRFYVVTDEGAMADFLLPKDAVDLVRVREFGSEAARDTYLKERGWS